MTATHACDAPTTLPEVELRLAIIGAGPAGLSLALQAARALPTARITVFDARPADKDVRADARTLALSQGTVQELHRMGIWDAIEASGHSAPIKAVHVSQQQPTVLWPGSQQPAVRISAQEQGVPQLGAVVSYGTLVAPLQAAWLKAVSSDEHRLAMRFGTPVRGFKPLPQGVEIDADIAESFDLAIVAEGGVFADQPKLHWPEGVSRDYEQTAWVGQVLLDDASAPGVAYERFTPSGPAALLPLPPGQVQVGGPIGRRAALVWCVQQADDPVLELNDAQRLTLLNTIFHEEVGPLRQMSSLKAFPLGLNAHTRLVSDEYGPSIYRFARSGRLIGALPVAASVRPLRNGVTDYSSNNPTAGQPAPAPANPNVGRANNQGFEGLSPQQIKKRRADRFYAIGREGV